jgi:predicted site-specific integrase-resolvase
VGGSGWNGRRKARLRIFRNPNFQVIVVERRERLMRSWWEYVKAALARSAVAYVAWW